MGAVEHNWMRRIDVEGVWHDGGQWGMDGTTSAARHELKQVETDVLAEYQAS